MQTIKTSKSTPLENLLKAGEINDLAGVLGGGGDPLAVPLVFAELHLTDRCNSRCRFCNQTAGHQPNFEMSYANLERLTGEMKEAGLRGIRLSGGGEPTAHPEFLKIIKFFRGQDVQLFHIDTNGLLLREKVREQLLHSQPRKIHISLVASDAERWSRETGLPKHKYDSLLSNLGRLVEEAKGLNTRIVVSFVIDEITYDSLLDMERLANHLGVAFFMHDLNTYGYGKKFYHDCMPVLVQALDYLDTETLKSRFYLKVLSDLETARKKRLKVPPVDKEDSQVLCLAPWCATTIRPDFALHPCCAIVNRTMPLGSYAKSSISSLRNGQRFRQMRDDARQLFLSASTDSPQLCVLEEKCRGLCGPRNGLYSHHKVAQLVSNS